MNYNENANNPTGIGNKGKSGFEDKKQDTAKVEQGTKTDQAGKTEQVGKTQTGTTTTGSEIKDGSGEILDQSAGKDKKQKMQEQQSATANKPGGKKEEEEEEEQEEEETDEESEGEDEEETEEEGAESKGGIGRQVMSFIEERAANMDKATLTKYAAVGLLLLVGMRKTGLLGGLAVSLAAGVITKHIAENAINQNQEEEEYEEEEEAVAA